MPDVSTRAPRAPRRRPAALPPRPALSPAALPWVERAPGVPYFALDTGEPWTPIGANESVTWPGLAGLFRRRDLAGAEAYLRELKAYGVTVLRLMLEYSQSQHRYFERPAGVFNPTMVRLWDDVFALCERVGVRVLLTPYDTFFQYIRWRHHPYNRRNGGPCGHRSQLLICRDTRELVKARLAFATERWGTSGALFAWDLWNELHPAQGANDYFGMWGFVTEVGAFLRELEVRRHGRAHPQTVSVFGPELLWKPELHELIFRHPGLDFASTHFYAEETIDDPRDTVAPAAAAARLTEDALGEIRDARPFFESEHGPIHTFKDRHRTLPEAFDDEYFRHIQWAHLASGGAGGGMRWPNRHPHALTRGMREAQGALARVAALVDWTRFARTCLNERVVVRDAAGGADDVPGRALALVTSRPHTPAGHPPVVPMAGREAAVFACGDARQAIVFLLRADALAADGRLRRDVPPRPVRVEVPGLTTGAYVVTECDPTTGAVRRSHEVEHDAVRGGGAFVLPVVPLVDAAVLLVRARDEVRV